MEGYEFPTDAMIEHGGAQVHISEHPVIKDTPDPMTAFKRLIDMRSELGRRARIPGKDSKPEEVKEFFSKLEVPPDADYLRKVRGVPETPDKYQWQAPEGVEINDAWLGKAREFAHKKGWSNEDFSEAIEFHNGLMEDAMKVFQTKQEEGINALKSKWGADYDKNYAQAAAGVKAIFNGNEEALAKFQAFGLANVPEVAETMLQIGKLVAEDKSINGNPAIFDNSIEGIKTQIADIRVKTDIDGDEKGRRLEPLYKKLAALSGPHRPIT